MTTTLDDRLNAAKIIKRDELGLCEGIKYKFKENGMIDWRAMVNSEFLYPNEKWFTDRKKSIPTSVEGLDDEQCIVSLAGLKELLSLRGYESLNYDLLKDSNGEVSVKCTIVFSPNYETNFRPVSKADIVSAGAFNVSKDYHAYVHSIAANRAMARCIRNFLNIHIVSKEEIGDVTQESEQKKDSIAIDPYSIVMKRIDGLTLSENEVRDLCVKSGLDTSWKSFTDFREDGKFCRKLMSALPKS